MNDTDAPFHPTPRMRQVLARLQDAEYLITVTEACRGIVSRTSFYKWMNRPAVLAWWSDHLATFLVTHEAQILGRTLRAATTDDVAGQARDRRLFFELLDRMRHLTTELPQGRTLAEELAILEVDQTESPAPA